MTQKAQMHTLEHILNGEMVRRFGCERAFSAHIEKRKSKCDYRFERDLTPEEIEAITESVKAVIAAHMSVSTSITTRENAEKWLSLGRLPEEVGESLHIVHIGDWDHCLCVGEHVANSGEIDGFSIISTSWESGVLRVRFRNR